jgi:ribose 1,5-bisphosphokinase PhnN
VIEGVSGAGKTALLAAARPRSARSCSPARRLPYVTRPGAPVSTDAAFVVQAGIPGLQAV